MSDNRLWCVKRIDGVGAVLPEYRVAYPDRDTAVRAAQAIAERWWDGCANLVETPTARTYECPTFAGEVVVQAIAWVWSRPAPPVTRRETVTVNGVEYHRYVDEEGGEVSKGQRIAAWRVMPMQFVAYREGVV